MTRRRALVLAAVVLALLAPAGALAAAPKADLVDIEDEVMCTTCNVPLNIADSPQADDERAAIRSLIAQGRTKAQIKRELVAQYGEDVLALPDSGGVGFTAYAIPIVLGALVLAALVLLVPRWRRRPAAGIARSGGGGGSSTRVDRAAAGTPGAPNADGKDLSDEDATRLEADLARYEG